MRKIYYTITLASVLFASFTSIASSTSLSSTLDHLRNDLDRRIKTVQNSKMDPQLKRQALIQLRHIQSRYTTARSLSGVQSQNKAAEDLCRQLKREIINFDRRQNNLKATSAQKRSKNNSENDVKTTEGKSNPEA